MTHIFPDNTFTTSGSSAYEAELQRNFIDLQPELFGVAQKTLLVGKTISADLLALKASQDAALATAAVIASQLKTIAALQSEVSKLQKNPIRTTIICVKGRLTRNVTGVTPVCPSGYSLKS